MPRGRMAVILPQIRRLRRRARSGHMLTTSLTLCAQQIADTLPRHALEEEESGVAEIGFGAGNCARGGFGFGVGRAVRCFPPDGL